MSASSSGTPVSRMMVPNQQLESQFVQHPPPHSQDQMLCKQQQLQNNLRENTLTAAQHQYLLNLQESQSLPQNVHRQYITQQRNELNVPRINGESGNSNVVQIFSNVNMISPSSSSEVHYNSGKSNGSGQQNQTVITNVNYLSLPMRNSEAANSTSKIPNPSNQAPQNNMQFIKKPTVNVAAGWKRFLANNEIIYVSPTGVSLKTHTQIKQYLLTPGTCKCGLPCPLRPEYFFEFNSQVPNTPLKLALNSEQIKSLPCVHQRRVMENSLYLQNDVKRRKNGPIVDNKCPQVQQPSNTISTYIATSQILDKPQPPASNLSDAALFSKPQIWRNKPQNYTSQYHIPPSIAQNQTLIQSNDRVPAWHPETNSQTEEEVQSVINNKEKYVEEEFDDQPTENNCYAPSSQSPHLEEELMDEDQEEVEGEEEVEEEENGEELEEVEEEEEAVLNGVNESQNIPFRPQQHLQLQQQIQQHNNLLYRKSNQAQTQLNQKKTFPNPTQKSYIRYQAPENVPKLIKSTTYQTLPRNTITSVQAGKSNTTTTSVAIKDQRTMIGTNHSAPIRMEPTARHFIQQKPPTHIPQPPIRSENNSQLIMTSTGQILVMSNQNNSVSKSQIMQQVTPHHSSGQVLFQRTSTNTFTQSQGNTNGTTLVLNNGQNLITSPASSIITPKVITNNQQLGLLAPNQHQQLVSQQTVVLNTVPNSYVLQPNNQVVTQIMNNQEIIHQNQPQIMLSPTDMTKRKAKKRKNSTSSSPSITPTSLSPQSPIHSQQHQQIVQIQTAPQYTTQQQSFQMSPGIPGIVLNKNGSQSNTQQQQFILQNGQLVQPVNLIGQQVLVQAGLMMAPQTDTTLLQIQNVNMAGSNIITTPQGMVLRAQSPQNKAFLSPNGAGSTVQQSQQYIVGSNGQLSPINQIYTTQMGLMMPSQSQHATTTFMQQNTAIVPQQQTSQIQAQPQMLTIMKPQQQLHLLHDIQQSHHVQHQPQPQPPIESNSPPDTTTHSPRSPERPISQRSGGSDMVVSSSEPDSMVSPTENDHNFQHYSISPEKGILNNCPTNVKIRRIQYEPQHSHIMDKESPTIKPKPTTSPTTTTPKARGRPPTISLGSSLSRTTVVSTACTSHTSQPIYSPGELVWGSARGHPAWPGKIVNSPDGTLTPNDSAWVQWFGGRPNVELVSTQTLKTLSEGLDAHHKAQKDTRK
ncbi:hypothetical protein ACFFRR_005952 [Megaselia abdita]